MFEKLQAIKAALEGTGWQVQAGIANGRPITVVALSRRWEFPVEQGVEAIVATVKKDMQP